MIIILKMASSEKVKLIGLTGLNAAGKGTIADILITKGFAYYSLSDIVREKATELGLDHSRENLIHSGNLLRKEEGPSVLAKKIAAKLTAGKPAVIDSIRNLYEIEELKKLPGFFLIGVTAPADVRFERAKKRARVGFEKSLQEFIDIEQKENSSDPTKQQLFECLKKADAVITNEGSKEELEKKLVGLLVGWFVSWLVC